MYQRILFAADFDKIGYQSARLARNFANKFDATLYFIHVMEFFPAYAYPGFAGFVEVEEPLKEHAQEEMKKLAQELNVPESNYFLEMGTTKDEVLRVAKEINADLIVTGSHGKHGLAYLLGSTSSAISHSAKCDILILHPEKGN